MPWLVVVLDVCVRMSLRRRVCRSANLVMLGGVSLPFYRIWGQVLSPPTCGSASVKIMSGVLRPSTTLRAVVSASSLCVNPVCDLNPISSLVWMMLSDCCRSCLWGWWVKLSGSMAYQRMVLMLMAL